MGIIDLCDEGLVHAKSAWQKAHSNSVEEELAECFKLLFQILKKGQTEDNNKPSKIELK